jgi:hypothetical protein
MSAPESVRTKDGVCWTRRTVTSGGIALYAPEGVCKCPEFVMATLAELAEHGIVGSADVPPMPVGPVPQAPGGYPPALPWAALLDADDLAEFLDELTDSATANASSEVRLAEIERTCATWRLIAEAQRGHNMAPGPDAVTQVFAPVAALREVLDGEHFATVHHDYRVGHDLPLGCDLTAAQVEQLGNPFLGGGA